MTSMIPLVLRFALQVKAHGKGGRGHEGELPVPEHVVDDPLTRRPALTSTLKDGKYSRWRARWGWSLALLALTIGIRLPALLHPKGINDERTYSIVAIEMLDGGKPYVDAVERKPPLLFWTYAAILGVVGPYNVVGLHAIAVSWVLLTMAGLYAAGRMLFDRTAGRWAALLYCVYQPWLFAANLAFNGEVLMNLPLVWAVFLAMRRGSTRLRPELTLVGILLACAFLLKQPAAIAAVPLGLYVLLPGYRVSRGLEWRHSVLHAMWVSVGFAATLALVALVLQVQGILADAYYWTIADHDVPFIAWKRGIAMSAALAGLGWPMVGAALVSANDLSRSEPRFWRGRQTELLTLTILLLVSAVGAAASGRFFQHYFIQLIPPMALLAAPVLGRLTVAGTGPGELFSRRTVVAWLTISVLASFTSHSIGLAERREISDVGRYISAHSTPDQRIFVWGQSEGLYLDARRRPASRYITTYRLTGHIYGWPDNVPLPDTKRRVLAGAWDVLERELAEQPPKFIVDTEIVRPPEQRYAMKDFPVIQRLVDRDYRLVVRGSGGWIYERSGS
jgi:hypothetical protein